MLPRHRCFNLPAQGIRYLTRFARSPRSTLNPRLRSRIFYKIIIAYFAILNVKTLPFCLFDEVEAALDDANVNAFGNYLKNYKNKTQFLIITHKKKTMEYADTLYGITMQESGVSKLVSVKLNQKIETI